MALTTVVTTFDLADYFGTDFDARRTKAWATNTAPDQTIHDESTGETRIGAAYATVAADGTGSFSHWAPGADANPATWQTYYHFDVPDRGAPKGRRTLTFGPFTVTASGELTALVEEQIAEPTATASDYADAAGASAVAAGASAVAADVSADTATAAATAAEGHAVDSAASATAAAASADLAHDISNIDTPDALVATLIPASSGSATASALSASYARSKSSATEESATLSAELAVGTGWTLGTGWSGDFATGFTKTAGNTNPLTWTPPFLTGTKRYQVEFQVDTPGGADLNYLFAVQLGGSYAMVMYEGSFLSHDYSRGIRSTADGNLVFTPESLFAGTISNISIKEISTPFEAPTTFRDSNGDVVAEMRFGAAALHNVFWGKNTGQWNTTGKENVVIGDNSFANSSSGFWNAGVGFETLRDNVNGTRNCTLGFYTLRENIDGHRNIAIGPFALMRNTHGFANIAIGADTLWFNTTGNYHIGIGQAALGETTAGGESMIGIGRAALGAADGLSYHIAIGDYAGWQMQDESTGNQIAIGRRALRNATRGGNIVIGYESGLGVTTAHGITVVGHEALQAVTTALNSTAVGRYAARYMTGQRNTAFGMNSMAGVSGSSTGEANTGLGYGTLSALTTGNNNVAIGSSAGATVTTGSGNILIGQNAQSIGPTDSGYLNIGNTLYGYMTGTKRLGIGVTSPEAALHIRAGVATAGGAALILDQGVLLTTPRPNAIENDGDFLYYTNRLGVRKQLATI